MNENLERFVAQAGLQARILQEAVHGQHIWTIEIDGMRLNARVEEEEAAVCFVVYLPEDTSGPQDIILRQDDQEMAVMPLRSYARSGDTVSWRVGQIPSMA